MKFNVKILAISLILLCCLMGAASAADDVSMDAVDASVDDAITVDATIDDTDDSTTVEDTPVDSISDDTAAEEINRETQTDEISEESALVDSEPTRSTNVNAADWATLRGYCIDDEDTYTITLTGTSYNIGADINFGNSATIIGTPTSYITGGSSSQTPFISSGSLDITFTNVTFRDIDASVFIRLATSGTNKFINCSFDNVHTYDYHSSVIWNEKGFMNISGCNFTNCNDGFGAVTNYATTGTVQMNVENCRFENNTGRLEPGAINNCGNLTVTDSTFIHNVATWWAGAIHTHTDANTTIIGSTFTDNVAGWNGGALYSYSKLVVINSTFTGNNCSTNNGGGAIGGYSYGSIYNITVDSCNFTNNANLHANGYGGAIGVLNQGNLTVKNSTFINNSAKYGQAISAITRNVSYCINCTNCNCSNCPNCTNCTHVHSKIKPDAYISNNTFINHTGTGDTVVINGNAFIFRENIFINSTQNEHYDGIGNQYGLTGDNLDYVPPARTNSKLGASRLEDDNDIVYVDPEETFAILNACDKVNDGGIVYVPAGTYTKCAVTGYTKSFTLIGLDKDNVIISPKKSWSFGGSNSGIPYIEITIINMTLINPGWWENGVTFINCTFINFSSYADHGGINSMIWGNSRDNDFENSFVTNFTNCNFINSTLDGRSLLDVYKFTQINFNNCTFENITADSIVKNIEGFTLQDAINFRDCTFTNVVVKGIVDVPTGTNPIERYCIEGCTGVENFGPITEGDRDFVNATGSKTETVMVAEIDADGNLFINLTDASGNAMAEEEVLISINGAEATPYAIGTDGTLSIALTDLTDATGKLNIAVSYEENDDYKGSTGSVSTVLVIKNVTVEVPVEVPVYVPVNQTASSITASDLTATAKVAKTLSVTLKDADGKVLANKAVKVTVNGKTSTVTTDKNGVAKVNVNYAKAGTYYYTLSFLGDNDYKASMKAVKVTVNKQATKATFAKKTFKVKATKKVTFTLKDAKGKAIKGKKITFTVNKKTYTAKTNAKGIATVKVKLTKKGKYTATAKFAGDTTYKAISKKAAITVK